MVFKIFSTFALMKLKKHINILLAALILVSNAGLAFNVHYCESKISGISFSYNQEEPCVKEEPCEVEIQESCCALEKEHDSCCKNDKVEIKKTTSENVLIKAFQLQLAPFIAIGEWSPFFVGLSRDEVQKNDAPEYYCETNAPPLYKLYSQFIFYA